MPDYDTRDQEGREPLGDFTLTIATSNDAMNEPIDVAFALRRVAQRLSDGDTSGRVMDQNGNTVGTFEFADA